MTPKVACLRCRQQKLKCDRELPVCKRCQRQDAVCNYPLPPDRKRIAKEASMVRMEPPRSRPTSFTPLHNIQAPVSPSAKTTARDSAPLEEYALLTPSAITSATTPESHRPVNGATTKSADDFSSETVSADLPPKVIGKMLMDVYFDRISNASLLFHRAIALELYTQDSVPDYVLRAIFAQAAVFFKDSETPHKQQTQVLSIRGLSERSWPWARSSSEEVLSHVDEPTIHKIQALQVLQLYYYSRGERDKAYVHATLAFQLAQLLGYHTLVDDAVSFSHLSQSMRFSREMKRRIFWASWCTMCFGDSPPQCIENIIDLPLPAKFLEGGTVHGVDLELGPTLNNRGATFLHCLHDNADSPSRSLMAELVTLTGVLVQVQTLISTTACVTHTDRDQGLQEFKTLLESLKSRMRLPVRNLAAQAERYAEKAELFASICSLYHLIRLLIHAPRAPIFKVNTVEALAPDYHTHRKFEAVLEEANAIAKLLAKVLAEGLDVTKLWPCSGYAAYVAGSVFLTFRDFVPSTLPANRSWQTPSPSSQEFANMQTVLDILKEHWEPLRALAAQLRDAVDTGVLQDPGYIVSCAYPWKICHPGPII